MIGKEYTVTDKYVIFWGSFLSNFYNSPFKYDEHVFRSSEQFFMWQKAKFFDDEYIAEQILKADSPKEAKRLGRAVRNYDDSKWYTESIVAMSLAIKLKFDNNDELRKRLLSFGDRTFVEGSPYDKNGELVSSLMTQGLKIASIGKVKTFWVKLLPNIEIV